MYLESSLYRHIMLFFPANRNGFLESFYSHFLDILTWRFITIRISPTISAVGSGGERRLLKWIIQGLSSRWNYCNHYDYKTLTGAFGSHQCPVKTEVLCYQQYTRTWQIHHNFFPISYRWELYEQNLLEHLGF